MKVRHKPPCFHAFNSRRRQLLIFFLFYGSFFFPIVGMDGSIARLTCIDPIVVESDYVSNVQFGGKDGNDSSNESGVQDFVDQSTTTNLANDSISSSDRHEDTSNKRRRVDPESSLSSESLIDWDVLQSELSNLIQNDSVSKAVIQFLRSSRYGDASATTEDQRQQQQFIELPSLAPKEQRRAVHEWVKQHLSNIAAADTAEGGIIRIWHKDFRSSMPNKLDSHHGKGNTRTNVASALPPRDRPYLQFVLYKENMDTGLALQMISKRANSFGSNSNRGRGGRGSHNHNNCRIRLGYAGNKDKRGITCQYVTIPARDTSIKHLCNVFNGTLNDIRSSLVLGSGHTQSAGVGMIRLGNFLYSKQELRLGRLRGNRFHIALRNIILPKGKDAASTTSSKSVLTQAVTHLQQYGFINYFGTQRFGKYHNTHITGLAVLRGDYRTAIDSIVCPPLLEIDPPSSETENSNATNSHHVAIRTAQMQWRDRFQAFPDSDDTAEQRVMIEQDLARHTLSILNHYMQSEIAILQSLSRFPLEYEKAFFCITKTMRMMFIHAVQSLLWNKCASYRIDTLGQEIVVGDLVLANSSEMSSENGEGCPEVEVVTELDVREGRYTIYDVVLPLVGVKTRNPENLCGAYLNQQLFEYNISREMMVKMQQTNRDFHCLGDYRKLICRPTNMEYEIVEYRDEFQPLLQTDFMKLNGVEVPHRQKDYATLPGRALLGMVVEFTLPSSAYATICLRELMQRPTSSEYQRELSFGGDEVTEQNPTAND
jgi:tRNA pseudouridine13 synthase